MKSLFLSALAFSASTAFAGQIIVMEAKVPVIFNNHQDVSTRFYMDQQTGQGYVKATVNERVQNHHPRSNRGPSSRQVFSEMVKVEGLMLMGDQAVYHGSAGNVVCGTMGESRFFKVPTLYLSGDCSLSSTLVNEGGRSKKLTVTMTTK